MGWALIRGWAVINFFCLQHGRLFEVGANSRLGAYSNKYGIIALCISKYLFAVRLFLGLFSFALLVFQLI